MVVRRRADSAETEHDVVRSESAFQGSRNELGIVADVLSPAELQSARTEHLNRFGKMLVLAFARQDLIADDDCPEAHSQSPTFTASAVNVGLELLDRLLLVGDHLFHQIADGKHADQALAFGYRKMAYAALGHDCHAVLHRLRGLNRDHLPGHDFAD